MLRYARFALLAGLATTIPVVSQQQTKQETKDDRKKVEPAKAQPAKKDVAEDERIDRRNSRMKERNREIDGMLNKQKK